MTEKHSFGALLHRATHRVPGVPAHHDNPAGHHRANRAHQRPRHHSTVRQPRVLVSWQRRVAAFFGQELP